LALDLAENPGDPAVLLGLAMAHLRSEAGPKEAIEYARQSQAGFPKPSPAHLNASLVLASAYHAAGDQQAELQALLAAQVDYPRDAAVLARLSGVYETKGDLPRAAACLRKLLAEGKVSLSVLNDSRVASRSALRLGQLYIQMGQRLLAEQLWTGYLKRRPGDELIRRALAASLTASHTIVAGRQA
jgi:tetratricopeptide (TPR) repeat protein